MRAPEKELLCSLPAAVLVVEDGRIAFANPAAAGLTGRSADDLAGAALEEVLAPPIGTSLLEAARQAAPFTLSIIAPGGHRRQARARVSRQSRSTGAGRHRTTFFLVLDPATPVAPGEPERVRPLIELASVVGALDGGHRLVAEMELVARATAADFAALFERVGTEMRPFAPTAPPEREHGLAALAAAFALERCEGQMAFGRASSPPDLAAALGAAAIEEALATPFWGGGDSFGLLVVARQDPKPFTAEDRALLQSLGAPLGAALTHQRLLRESSRQVHDLQSLFELGRTIAGEHDLPRVSRLAVRTAAALVGAQEVFLLELKPGLEATQLALTTCLHDGFEPPSPGAVSDEVAHETLEHARQLGLSAIRQNVAISDAWMLPPAAGHLAAAPLVTSGRPLGCLVAQRLPTDPRAGTPVFEESDLQRLRAVADYLAMALQSGELFAEQKRRVRELSVLNDVAADCAELGLERLLPAVNHRICWALGAELSALWLYDPLAEELVDGAASGPLGPLPGRLGHARVGAGLARRALAAREPSRGAAAELGVWEVEELAAARGLAFACVVPLIAQDRPIGLVAVARADRSCSNEEVSLLLAICSEIAVAVDNARLFQDATRRTAELELVHEVGDVLARSLDARRILPEAVERLARALEADAVQVYVRDGVVYRSAADFGLPAEPARITETLTVGDPAIARALKSEGPVALVSDEMPEPTRSFCRRIGVTSLAAAPLLIPGSKAARALDRGALLIGRKQQRSFSPEELQVVGVLASQIAVALGNAQLYDEARQSVEDLSIVAEAGRALVGEAPLGEALDQVATRLAHLIGVRACLVFLIDPADDALHVRGLSREVSAGARQLVIGRSTPGSVTAQAIRAHQAVQDPAFAQNVFAGEVEKALGWRPRWTYGLPLDAGERTIGAVILTDDTRVETLSESESARVAAIGSQVASAVERGRLNEALEKSLVELERTQEQLVRKERLAALGELAALVAHEVRNPLGVIFTSLGSLSKLVALSGDAQRLYDLIRDEADRLNRIVGDLLDYTRPPEPLLRPGALDEVLYDAVESAQASEKSRGTPVEAIELSVAAAAGLPPVPIDERLVHQAVVNLLSNALQSVPRGGHVKVSVALASSHDRPVARIEVEDDGPGIPPELAPRLFEPFFTTKAKGSGLGLAVVKRIVDGHRGEVRVHTRPGEGTTFVVDLPL